MSIRIGINGFGRIGRMALRAALNQAEFKDVEVVAINGLDAPEHMLYLLKYDSVHGRLAYDAHLEGAFLVVDGQKIRLTAEADPAKIDWAQAGVDVVLECTGVFLTTAACAAHLAGGARAVVQSAPAKDETPMYVYGVNHYHYRGEAVISAASCTTNGLAPIVKVLHDHFAIRRGLMTTIHAATATQNTVDAPSGKDWRGGRGVFDNIIPSSTGAAKAVGKVIPALQHKLTGMAMRIPSADVSVVDLTVELQQKTSYEDICAVMQYAAERDMKGVLGYTSDAVVSSDFRGCSAASVFDAGAGLMLDPTFVKLIGWYDNEYGYTCNLLRLSRYVGYARLSLSHLPETAIAEAA